MSHIIWLQPRPLRPELAAFKQPLRVPEAEETLSLSPLDRVLKTHPELGVSEPKCGWISVKIFCLYRATVCVQGQG